MNKQGYLINKKRLIWPIILMPISFIAAYLGMMFVHFAEATGISLATEYAIKLIPALLVPTIILIGFNQIYKYSAKEVLIILMTGIGWLALAIFLMMPAYLNNFN